MLPPRIERFFIASRSVRAYAYLLRASGGFFDLVRANSPLANSETKSVLDTMEATVYEASMRRLNATDAPVVHCFLMCTRWMIPKTMNSMVSVTSIIQIQSGGEKSVPRVCPMILENRRMITEKPEISKSHPTMVAAIETLLYVPVAVVSDMYPQIIQHNVATHTKSKTSVELTPQVTAIVNSIMVAVMLYSTHRTQLLPRLILV